ncbi:hypothetical protein GIX45_28405 [Erwinia sp. CPCC 100877]|nr:hypothetical protein [Erwinia sp. CPCC 100877]
MTEKTEYYELEMAYEFLDAIETESLPEEVAGSIMEAWGFLKSWLEEHRKNDDNPEPPFAVGEYYVDEVFIYKVRRVNPNSLKVDYLNKQTGDFVENASWSLILPKSEPATAEQIAEFKRAEQFAAKGRGWSEFRKGDKVLNNNTGRIGIVESVDEDGDVVVNYKQEGPLSIKDYKCTGALYLDLIQTAEELQEVADDTNI